jgi:PilZ domain
LGNSPDLSASYSERRKAPRYSFVATTELVDTENASKLTGRVTEIGRNGCYVDILNILPVGTSLFVRISCDGGTFETKGRILYAHERIGIGVQFLDTSKDQLEILDSWLAKLPPLAAP